MNRNSIGDPVWSLLLSVILFLKDCSEKNSEKNGKSGCKDGGRGPTGVWYKVAQWVVGGWGMKP